MFDPNSRDVIGDTEIFAQSPQSATDNEVDFNTAFKIIICIRRIYINYIFTFHIS